MTPLDSHRLQAFATVARERGFSRAARALGKTQSSVSEAVAQLEEELGHRLFWRDARSTSLTDEGRVLLEHAERILDEMQAARVRLTTGEASGELAVGATDTLACHLLPPVFAAFRSAHPAVTLRLVNRPSPALALEVMERNLHLAVVSLPLPSTLKVGGRPVAERLKVEALAPQEDVAIVWPGHPAARRPHFTLGQLATERLLLLDRSTSTRSVLERAFEAAGASPEVVIESASVDVLKRLVELQFGVSVVPSWSVQREVKAKTLAALPIRALPKERAVGLLTHLSSRSSRAARAFAELTRRALGAR
jgi:DNA-binding transcriptional LysR family regulator